MTVEQSKKIKDFIKNNNLTFQEGRRNTDSVTLSGYALYLGIGNTIDLEKIIDVECPHAEWNYTEELKRVFQYANEHAYGNWWNTEEAKNSYKF